MRDTRDVFTLGQVALSALWVLLFVIVVPVHAMAQNADATLPDINPWALLGDPVLPSKPPADKSAYSLFSPVPTDQMRAFSTDRPGKTHSSTTVDAGHFQVESDFLNYTYDHYSPQHTTTESYSIGTPIFKMGVTNWADFEAGFAFYNQTRVKNRSTGATQTGSGAGDVLLGGKINIFGNDNGRQALALLPFVKIPTAASNVGNGVTEFTLNAPYTIALDTLWSVTLEPAAGLLKNANNDGLHGDYSFLVNLNRPIFDKDVVAALEFASEYSSDRQITPRYTADPSLQWVFMPNVQLDIGVYLGLNKAAPDYNPYAGISYRY